jgi:cobalamin biosynthesis protein CobD/CbiB
MMGTGRRDAKASDIRRALALYRYADAILVVVLIMTTSALIGSI